MYTNIIENEGIMSMLKADVENYESNCYILNAVRNLPYEQQLVIAKGLLLKDKEIKSRKNVASSCLNISTPL